MHPPVLDQYVTANSRAFGSFIDPERVLFDAPQLSLIEVDLPEYHWAGLGRVLLQCLRYHFTDLGVYGVEGMSVGAESSRGVMVYEDMHPAMVAANHWELHETAKDVAEALRKKGYPPELISVAVLRSKTITDFERLCNFIDVYHARSTWIESNPVEIRFATLEAMGGGTGVDWERALPTGPRLMPKAQGLGDE